VTLVVGPEQPEGPANDLDIPDEDVLLRRLSDSGPNMIAWDLETRQPRPSSGAFKPDDDGVSVYRLMVLTEAGLTPDDVVREPLNVVVGLGAGDVRSLGLGIRNDPWPQDIDEPEHPRNVAHALITGLELLGKKQRIRRQRELTMLESVQFLAGAVS
jgi:hypothetical protein